MEIFKTARDAKEYLVSRILAEADRDGISLSDIERKMLYFSETGWTLPDMRQVSEAFDRDYEQDDYEAKISSIVQNARPMNERDLEMWDEAVLALKREDHYLIVLIDAGTDLPHGSAGEPLVDRVKLVATAAVIIVLMMAYFYFFGR